MNDLPVHKTNIWVIMMSVHTHYYSSALDNFRGLEFSFGTHGKSVFSLIADYLVINLSN